jgi:hypothetical protein
MPTVKLIPEIITAAIAGFEAQKTKIDLQIEELRAMLDGGPTHGATPEATTGKRRKFSAATRQRMKAAQQRRWAKIRGESQPPAPATPEKAKPKRRISEEGMKRIIAATKKRWRLQKAAAKAKSAVAKKTAPPRSAVKRVAMKKSAVKKTTPAPTPAASQVGAQ